jgi:hypothetical protein
VTPEREAEFRQMTDDRGRHNFDIGHYWNAVDELLAALDECRAKLAAAEAERDRLAGIVWTASVRSGVTIVPLTPEETR